MRIALLFSLFSTVHAQYKAPFQCPLPDIALFFGNGVNNLENDADDSLDALQDRLKSAAHDTLDLPKIVVGDVLYNTKENILLQLLEVFMQKMHEFQLNFWNWLFDLSSAPDWFREKLLNLIMLDEWTVVNPADLDSQLATVHDTLGEGLNVLIVAHSQGNMFANSVYRLVRHDLKNRVTLVSVATPSDKVEGGGPHVTLMSDGVIVALTKLGLKPTPLAPNVENESPKPGNFDHQFVTHYLNGVPAGSKIIQDSISQVRKLADSQKVETPKSRQPSEGCVRWFDKGNVAKARDFNDCLETCTSTLVGMESYECTLECDILCGCPKRKSIWDR